MLAPWTIVRRCGELLHEIAVPECGRPARRQLVNVRVPVGDLGTVEAFDTSPPSTVAVRVRAMDQSQSPAR